MIQVTPVILCGGSGTRLWPLSRTGFPKQFLCLTGNESLFQQAAQRLVALGNESIQIAAPVIVSGEDHRFLASEQLREVGIALGSALLEPTGRNTAPALTLAALTAVQHGQDPVLVVTPADQTIANPAAFTAAVQQAISQAEQGNIVILGVTPDKPETGYGYIHTESSDSLPQQANAFIVQAFVEKPNLQTAQQYHPPAKTTGLQIEHIFSIAQARKNSLWIDSKNINNPVACNQLAKYIEINHHRVGQIFIEFPDTAVNSLSDLQKCSNRMKDSGARTSYYVPTHLLLRCAENPIRNFNVCSDLNTIVQKVISSKIFTDLSFDFSGYQAMKIIPGAEKLKWNTWAINAQDFHLFPSKDFSFIIMNTSADPNTN